MAVRLVMARGKSTSTVEVTSPKSSTLKTPHRSRQALAVNGKNAHKLQKQFVTSPKHASLKKLTPAEEKDLAAYLASLK
jgi:hypothetical protein